MSHEEYGASNLNKGSMTLVIWLSFIFAMTVAALVFMSNGCLGALEHQKEPTKAQSILEKLVK